MIIRKFNNIFEFFKTTLVINLAICAVAITFGGFDCFFICFLSFGFLLSLGFKEIYRKNDYLFYLNNRIGKIQLFVYSYILTFLTAVFFGLIIFLIKKIF